MIECCSGIAGSNSRTVRRLSPAETGQKRRCARSHHDHPWTLFGVLDRTLRRSVRAAERIGRTLTAVFAPMGISADNWPALVGILSGIFAKEVVVGALDGLYSGIAAGSAKTEVPFPEEFNLWGEISAAMATVPENFGAASESFHDPLGLAIIASSEPAALGVSTGAFAAIRELFDGRLGAFSYLLFILL